MRNRLSALASVVTAVITSIAPSFAQQYPVSNYGYPNQGYGGYGSYPTLYQPSNPYAYSGNSIGSAPYAFPESPAMDWSNDSLFKNLECCRQTPTELTIDLFVGRTVVAPLTSTLEDIVGPRAGAIGSALIQWSTGTEISQLLLDKIEERLAFVTFGRFANFGLPFVQTTLWGEDTEGPEWDMGDGWLHNEPIVESPGSFEPP